MALVLSGPSGLWPESVWGRGDCICSSCSYHLELVSLTGDIKSPQIINKSSIFRPTTGCAAACQMYFDNTAGRTQNQHWPIVGLLLLLL